MSELGNRVRAARAYAGSMSQDDLAGRLPFSLSTLQRTEAGGRELNELEEPAFVDAVSRATGLPGWFFSVDLNHGPPEDQLARLDATVRELIVVLERLAKQADDQLQDGSEKLDLFGQVITQAVALRSQWECLPRVEAKLDALLARPPDEGGK